MSMKKLRLILAALAFIFLAGLAATCYILGLKEGAYFFSGQASIMITFITKETNGRKSDG